MRWPARRRRDRQAGAHVAATRRSRRAHALMPQLYAQPGDVDLSFTKDPRFTFDEPRHLYAYDGQPLASAGSIMKELCVPFDKERIAGYVARRQRKTKAVVLAEWETKRDRAARRGEAIHYAIEHYLL